MESSELNAEQLAQMIETAAVENYTRSGNTPTGDRNLLRLLDYAESQLGLSSGQNREKNGMTRMAEIPLSTVGVHDFHGITKDLLKKLGDNVALCFASQGMQTDQYGRNGILRSIIVMNPENAKRIVQAVQTDPSIAYSLIRVANGGPIKKFDGTPATILCGNAIEMLPNNKVGGTMQAASSSPFPKGFAPNPLF